MLGGGCGRDDGGSDMVSWRGGDKLVIDNSLSLVDLTRIRRSREYKLIGRGETESWNTARNE